jgi:hypothetical protein
LFTTTPIDNIAAGQCFAFRKRGQTYVAMASTSVASVVVLWPHLPTSASALLGLMDKGDLRDESLGVMPRASVFVPADLAALRDRAEFKEQLGALIVGDQLVWASIHYKDRDIAFIDLTSGKIEFKMPDRFVWFEKWSIAVPTHDGYDVVCTIPK